MTIKVTVPMGNHLWKVSFGGSPNYRRNAIYIFKLIERRLLKNEKKDHSACLGIDEKTSILVQYTCRTSNETIETTDIKYLLYTLLCFLEDYLANDFLNKKYKQYSK